jgi:hypothetical protein
MASQQLQTLINTLVVETGTVAVPQDATADLFVVGNTNQALAPLLLVTDTTINVATLLAPVPADGPAPGEYAKLRIAGDVTMDAEVGLFTPTAAGDPAYQPGFLTVELAAGATLRGEAELWNGGLRIGGDGSTAIEDFHFTLHGTDFSIATNGLDSSLWGFTSSATLAAPVTGDSVLTLAAGPADALGYMAGGSLSIRGSVGADTELRIEAGAARVFLPAAFEATVDLVEHGVAAQELGNVHSGHLTTPPVDQSLFLNDLKATAWGFNDATHTMTLYHGSKVVEQIQFDDHITASDFHQTASASHVDASFVVAAYSNGVDIGNYWQTDAHLLPMRADEIA